MEMPKTIVEYDPVEGGLARLREKYAGVVFDVATTNGLDCARKARAEIREPRYEVEKIRKRLKAPALEYSRRIDTEAARITAELEKIEGPINEAIRTEEAAAEARREAKRKAEAERLAEMRQAVDTIRSLPIRLFGASADELRRAIEECANRPIAEMPEEIQEEALTANQQIMATLRQMLREREVSDAEAARQAEERERWEREQAAEREEIAARERDLAAERKRQREEHKAEMRRLAEERALRQAERAEQEARMAEQTAAVARQAREAHERERLRAEEHAEALRVLDTQRAEAARRAAEERAEQQRQAEEIVRQKEELLAERDRMIEELARLDETPAPSELPSYNEMRGILGGHAVPPEPAGSSDLIEALEAEYLELAIAGDIEAIDYAQAESEEIAPTVTAILVGLLRDARPGSSPLAVHEWATGAREHLLDHLMQHVAQKWALAQYDKRVEATEEMVSEWD